RHRGGSQSPVRTGDLRSGRVYAARRASGERRSVGRTTCCLTRAASIHNLSNALTAVSLSTGREAAVRAFWSVRRHTHAGGKGLTSMDELDQLVQCAEAEIAEAASTAVLAQIETKYLGGKGSLQAQLRAIGSLPKEERPAFGARVNAAKQAVTE